jgi:epoxyqueuosine reductase
MHRLSHVKQRLTEKAFQLGFSHIGIASSQPVPHFQSFKRWIDAGYHAGMHYLAREDTLAKRADPGLILEGCQRVICLAMPYNFPLSPHNAKNPGFGRISAYAFTKDYHLIIAEKLQQLEDFLINQVDKDVLVKSYVDTGPVLERGFAAQAGLGIPGKNGNLIIPRLGSYIFLAVMLTDLALPIDTPFNRDVCGSCRRCIEACPTGCIQSDRTIDASRCISYLTIENKEIIPDPLKRNLGDWLFGCDICQMVCPHNSRLQAQISPLGKPDLPEWLGLKEILTWSKNNFRLKTEGTALNRAKLRGLVRNAVVIIGNQSETTMLPLLKKRLTNEADPIIRDALHWAIEQIVSKNSENDQSYDRNTNL